MHKIILITAFLFIGLNVSATTPLATNVFLEIQEEVEKICSNKEDKDSCKKEMNECIHRESQEFPFDALDVLEGICKNQN